MVQDPVQSGVRIPVEVLTMVANDADNAVSQWALPGLCSRVGKSVFGSEQGSGRFVKGGGHVAGWVRERSVTMAQLNMKAAESCLKRCRGRAAKEE
jgi:hypothetical protein